VSEVIEREFGLDFYAKKPERDYYVELVNFASVILRPGSKILDLGCSVGRLSFELAKRGFIVVGADPAIEQIQESRKILQTGKVDVNLGLRRISGDPATQSSRQMIEVPLNELVSNITDKIEFIAADQETLPFASRCFDAIFCSAVIDRVEDPDAFIRKADWYVRDGGYLIISSPFDWEHSPASKERWLGFGAYNTTRESPEKALTQFMRKRSYRLIKEINIPWVTYADCRHYHIWNTYVGVYQTVRPNIHLITSKESSPELVETFRRVYGESPVYSEKWSYKEARESLSECSTLLVASNASDSVVGFAGGHEWTEKDLHKYEDAHEILEERLGLSPIFWIDELGVDSPFQRFGIGERLFKMLLARAKVDGYHTFALITNPDNEVAIDMYQRNGFSRLCYRDGIITREVTHDRIVPRNNRDLRSYFFRVDDFSKFTLKNGEQICLEFFEPKQWKEPNLDPLKVFADKISVIFGEAFYPTRHPPKIWNIEHIMTRLPEIKLGVLAYSRTSRKAIAYALFNHICCGEQRILFVDAIGISQVPVNWQGSGIGTTIIRETLKRLPAENVAARTQNPSFVKILQKLNPDGQIVPLDRDYGRSDKRLLRGLIKSVKELKEKRIILNNGLCRMAYSEGKLGDYQIDARDKEIEEIEKRFNDIRMDRDRGDAIVFVSKDLHTKPLK
jgi:2-polyprenyl-3-methyl-5-hydroxy-6-metoxy-1,4-benzoquinol methylase/ribosomal protein S18 acetylase RimI-like enzyme